MKILSISFFVVCLSFLLGNAQEKSLLNHDLYGIGDWDEDSLGNHRAVIEVEEKGDVVWAHIPWRRRDFNPEKKGVIIVNAVSKEIVQNVFLLSINREYGDILFQPENATGEYYIYYLKHFTHGRSNYPTVTYPTYVSNVEKTWLNKAEKAATKLKKLPKAKLVQFQSIDQFNSFFPMEIIATGKEIDDLIQTHVGKKYLLFPESRENSIRMTSDIPLKWIQDGVTNKYSGKAMKGEYFTFQVGVFAAQQEIENIEVELFGLQNQGKTIVEAEAFTCFNTEGIDWEGQPFKKECSIEKGKVQALWFGIQVPENIYPGLYESTILVKPVNMEETKLTVHLEISSESIIAAGDNEPERLSRLRWLNSTVAEDNGIVNPYTALQVEGNKVKCLGREVEFGPNGFPLSIKSFFSESLTRIQDKPKELLSAPINLIIETDDGARDWENNSLDIVMEEEGIVVMAIQNEMPGLIMDGTIKTEFDGNIDYRLILTATADMDVNDIRLEIPLHPDAAKYMMGLGQKGGFRPEVVDWKWAIEKNQDGPWVGDVNGGIQARFRDDNYSRPLNTNFYQLKPLHMPSTWYNGGKGGIYIAPKNEESITITSYSGNRTIKKGEQLHFYFNLLITPFRPIDTKKHWGNRYYHSFKPVDTVAAYGANTINVHHANEINPFINYPFLRPDKMKAYIDDAHAKDLKVKIYYTVRELSNKAPELYMLRSLGEEVFSAGKGGGFSWLQEHLESNYIAAWFVPSLKDAAIINRGISRWHNFYIEGLSWLVKNIGIDGLYIDDLAFDRTSMKRIRKVLERGNPGALIDLHSANQFNPRDGFTNSANLYLEHFPYIDRLWFGEYFDYDYPPEFWLIETSGIPFGLMGEMLQGGGNPWRGMIFGMTSRAPWSGDPSLLWKVWDDFEIEKSDMIGYWVSNNPVKTNSEKTKATAYVQKGESTLISIATWAEKDDKVDLEIDWKALGLDQTKAELYTPAIDEFQGEKRWKPGEEIVVPKGKGFLIVVKEK